MWYGYYAKSNKKATVGIEMITLTTVFPIVKLLIRCYRI